MYYAHRQADTRTHTRPKYHYTKLAHTHTQTFTMMANCENLFYRNHFTRARARVCVCGVALWSVVLNFFWHRIRSTDRAANRSQRKRGTAAEKDILLTFCAYFSPLSAFLRRRFCMKIYDISCVTNTKTVTHCSGSVILGIFQSNMYSIIHKCTVIDITQITITLNAII